MAFYGKLISIKDGRANTIICTSPSEFNRITVKFIALSIYARDIILDITKLGQLGFKIYSLESQYPLHKNFSPNEDSEIIKDNKYGFGAITRYLKNNIDDSFSHEDVKDFYFPLVMISANHCMEEDSIKEVKSNIDEVTKDSLYYYSFIVDYDTRTIRIVSYEGDDIDTLIDFNFDELDYALNQDLASNILLRMLNNNQDLFNDYKDLFWEEVNQLIYCEAKNTNNAKELLKNSIFIFNKSNKPSALLEKLNTLK